MERAVFLKLFSNIPSKGHRERFLGSLFRVDELVPVIPCAMRKSGGRQDSS